MGACKSVVIISPNPNTQNDKKPIPSIFYRKSEELPASVILLHGSDGIKNSGLAFFCQQIIAFFLQSFRTAVSNARTGCHGMRNQCPLQCPPQQPPPPLPQAGALLPPALTEAKVENFLDNFFEPQCGHSVFFEWLDRTRISLSRSHFPQ
jgi:hypothetical protein